jgi:hypothetical protein
MKIKLSTLMKPVLLAVPFLVFSCSDDEDPVNAEPKLEVVEEEFAINAAYEDTDLLTLDILQSSGLGLRTQTDADICANTVVTHNEATKKITIDFGTGCTSPSGVVRKGKVLLTYTGSNFILPGTSIVTTFEGYEVDGLKIEGSRTITNAGIDLINSRVTLNVKIENGKVTWPDDSSATYTSTQSRVLTLVNDSYQVAVSGNSAGKSREGFDYTAVVTDPLIVNQECIRTGVFVPSAGKMDFVVLGITISADLGDGACDKIVSVTYPGGSKEITLD